MAYRSSAQRTAGTDVAAAPVTTGSSVPFAAFTEKDANNASITVHYQSITAMPQYRSSSFEVNHI